MHQLKLPIHLKPIQIDYFRLMARSRDAAENSIRFYLNEIGKQEINGGSRPANKQRALVVDGKTLTFLLDPRRVDI